MKKLYLLISFLWLQSVVVFSQSENIPIKISSFEAGITNGKANFIWKTACSLEFAKFSLQRSSDGFTFETIHSSIANKERCTTPFYYTDSMINGLTGKIYFQLQVSDIDGKIYQSKTISVSNNGNDFEVANLTPNIVNETAILHISFSQNEEIGITIIGINGRMIQSKRYQVSKGLNNITLSLGALAKGKYWAVVYYKDEKKTIPFVKM